MQHTEQISLIERALRHIATKSSDREQSFSAPLSFYNSPEQHKKEKEVLFTKFPLVAGFSSQLKAKGDYFVFDFGERSILIVKSENEKLSAFSNYCRHRGTKLAEGSGQSRRFVCPYHAWTYDTDGKLLSAPHRENFENLEDCNLKSFPVAEKYGLIWVKPEFGASLDLDSELGSLAKDLESFGFGSHVKFAPKSFVSPINWKLMIEASLETYHFKYTHQKTIAPMFFDDLGVFDWSSPHGRMFLPKQAIKELKPEDRESWQIRPVGNLIYFFFPNTVLLVQPDHATWMSAYPITEKTSIIYGGTLIPEEATSEKSQKYWDKNVEIFWRALGEDFSMSEKIQLGLNSGDVNDVLFGKSEFLIQKFHSEINKRL